MYLNALNFLNTKSFVSLRFVGILWRYFRIWFRYLPSANPENFRSKYICPLKLWKSDTPFTHFYLSSPCIWMHQISSILRPSYLWDSLVFNKDISACDFTAFSPQTRKISEENTYVPQNYGSLIPRSPTFALARHVFECIKFLEY